METLVFAVIAAFILAFGLVSKRIQGTIISAPMVFATFGFILSRWELGMLTLENSFELVNIIAELTLVLILFTDASRISLKTLRREHDIPIRLLGIGLPLTMALGALVAAVLFGTLNIWEAIVLAVILAPTDAALGQAVVSDERVPVRIRQGLNVESGLNDGLALPVLLFFLAIADAAADIESVGYWVRFIARQLILGPLIGVAVGYVGGKLVTWGIKSKWMSEPYVELSALAISLLAYACAELVGGNGFIAAFCAGLTLGNTSPLVRNRIHDFAEAGGQLLTLLTFMIFGALMAPVALESATPAVFLYAILSLTLIRLVPVAVSLLGLHLKPGTLFFVGWFGPRGIASILYSLLLLERSGIPGRDLILTAVFVTVALSIFAHGITAVPCVKAYKGYTESEEDDEEMAEHMPVSEMPVRIRYHA